MTGAPDIGADNLHQLGDDHLKASRFKDARSIFEILANQGDIEGQVKLARVYCNRSPENNCANLIEGVRWYKEAAAQGSFDAQITLGENYHGGLLTGVDYSESFKYFRMAMEQGDNSFGDARKGLGKLYRTVTEKISVGLSGTFDDVAAAEKMNNLACAIGDHAIEWQKKSQDAVLRHKMLRRLRLRKYCLSR